VLCDELHKAICEMPVVDVHSHVNCDHMGAVDPEQVMFYHMLMYCLRSAGVADEKMWPEMEAKRRGLPFPDFFARWPAISHTGFGWILKRILRDLYEYDGPLTAENLPRIRKAFEAKTTQPDWAKQVLAKANVVRLCSSQLEVKPVAKGQWDGHIRFTIEDVPTTGTSEFKPWKQRLSALGKILGREVTTVEHLREAVSRFYDQFDWSDKKALVAWVSGEADFRPVDDACVNRLLADAQAEKPLDLEGIRLLEGAFIRAICRAIQGRTRIFQFCYGVQYLTPDLEYAHPVARAAPEFASSSGYLFGEFPDLHFNVLNGYEPDEPIWAAMCQAYGNVSLANFWWETFFPSVMHTALARRFDMVPLSRLIGFFSDGWCVEYVYGRLALVRRVLANVAAERVERGFWTREEALGAVREILFETPRRIFLPDEKIAV